MPLSLQRQTEVENAVYRKRQLVRKLLKVMNLVACQWNTLALSNYVWLRDPTYKYVHGRHKQLMKWRCHLSGIRYVHTLYNLVWGLAGCPSNPSFFNRGLSGRHDFLPIEPAQIAFKFV